MGLNWWEDSDVIGQWWSYMRFVGGNALPLEHVRHQLFKMFGRQLHPFCFLRVIRREIIHDLRRVSKSVYVSHAFRTLGLTDEQRRSEIVIAARSRSLHALDDVFAQAVVFDSEMQCWATRGACKS
jgi:hypothetical protein